MSYKKVKPEARLETRVTDKEDITREEEERKNKAVGANFLQVYCPHCFSENIELDAMVTDVDFGMTCNSCGYMWDGDEEAGMSSKEYEQLYGYKPDKKKYVPV